MVVYKCGDLIIGRRFTLKTGGSRIDGFRLSGGGSGQQQSRKQETLVTGVHRQQYPGRRGAAIEARSKISSKRKGIG